MLEGGDLHSHLTGAVYAESLIDRAASEGSFRLLEQCTVPTARDMFFSAKVFLPATRLFIGRKSEIRG
jgi:hypothetical protein